MSISDEEKEEEGKGKKHRVASRHGCIAFKKETTVGHSRPPLSQILRSRNPPIDGSELRKLVNYVSKTAKGPVVKHIGTWHQ